MSGSERRRRAALALALGLLTSSGVLAHESPGRVEIGDRALAAEFLRVWEGAFRFARWFFLPAGAWEKNGGSLDPWGQPNQAEPSPPAPTASAAPPPDGGR